MSLALISRRFLTCSRRLLAEAPKREDPIKFSQTKASAYDSVETFFDQKERQRPRFQKLIVSVSTSLFLIYFCILRKENDIDDWMYRPHPAVPLPYGQTYEQVLKEYETKMTNQRIEERTPKKE